MIPHVIGEHDRLLAVDFERQRILVGETTVAGQDSKRVVFRHARWTLRDGAWHQEHPPYTSKVQRPALDADSWFWRDAGAAVSLRARGERPSVLVERSDLHRALGHVSGLTSKSLDRDGLMTVTLDRTGLHLRTHGETFVSASFARVGFAPGPETSVDRFARHVGEFGSIVVLAEHLRAVVKQCSGRLAVSLDVYRRELVLAGRRVWSIAVPPLERVDYARPVALDSEVARAAVRALPFASTDVDRAILNHVRVVFDDDCTRVEASDGHRAFQERLDHTPPPSCSRMRLPRSLLKRFAKHADRLRLSVSETHALVEVDGLTVAVPHGGHSFPELGPIIAVGRRYVLPRELWHAMRDFGGRVERVELCFASREDMIIASRKAMIVAVGIRAQGPSKADVEWSLHGDVEALDPASMSARPTPEQDECASLRAVALGYLREVLDAFADDAELTLKLGRAPIDPLTFSDGTRTLVLMPTK